MGRKNNETHTLSPVGTIYLIINPWVYLARRFIRFRRSFFHRCPTYVTLGHISYLSPDRKSQKSNISQESQFRQISYLSFALCRRRNPSPSPFPYNGRGPLHGRLRIMFNGFPNLFGSMLTLIEI
jgi:hypothetical protein